MDAALNNASRASPPKVLPGFESIAMYWDNTHQQYSARIKPGEFYVTRGEEIITTVLGSCVAACIRDKASGIGGVNHFMLPDSGGGDNGKPVTESARYGSYAMEVMINTIMSHSGRRGALEVKLFGGSRVLRSASDIGEQNIGFVRAYLRDEGLDVVGEDLGGVNPRKIVYFPTTGKTLVKKLPMENEQKIEREEARYRRSLSVQPVSGDIDLF